MRAIRHMNQVNETVRGEKWKRKAEAMMMYMKNGRITSRRGTIITKKR